MEKTRSGPPPSPPSLTATIMQSLCVQDCENYFLQSQKMVVDEEIGGKKNQKTKTIHCVFQIGSTAFSDRIRSLGILVLGEAQPLYK